MRRCRCSGAPAPADDLDLPTQVELLRAAIRRFGIEDAVAQIVALEDLRAEIAIQQRKLDDLIAQVRDVRTPARQMKAAEAGACDPPPTPGRVQI
ncbi:hypothetical protein [Aeromicrobium sp. UC242_57]|uniref:hypothetical protein n=1 Tax=Aeromicrobium sp. UC242_57 TaxID=3374624 RepID=UPI00379CEF88